MLELSLEQIPNQEFEIILNGQDCKIHLYTRGEYLYFDLYVADTPFFYGAICYDRTRVIPISRDSFNGNFIFVDTLSRSNPEYSRLNERYILYYLTDDELESLNGF